MQLTWCLNVSLFHEALDAGVSKMLSSVMFYL